ncbi:MAG: hypothetical protein ACRD3W_28760, partial [Terriglobales bacterium]
FTLSANGETTTGKPDGSVTIPSGDPETAALRVWKTGKIEEIMRDGEREIDLPTGWVELHRINGSVETKQMIVEYQGEQLVPYQSGDRVLINTRDGREGALSLSANDDIMITIENPGTVGGTTKVDLGVTDPWLSKHLSDRIAYAEEVPNHLTSPQSP